jgi:MFS family permease
MYPSFRLRVCGYSYPYRARLPAASLLGPMASETIPRLSRPAWLVLAGDAMSAVGSGLTLPFLIVYLHEVRDFGLATSGLILAAVAAASLIGNPLAGVLCDWIGSRSTVVIGLVLAAAGSIALAGIRQPGEGFAAAAVVGLGVSIVWPAQDALLAELVEPAQRSAVFSVRHMTMNAGLGAGALLAAVVVDVHHAGTFTALYVLDGVSFLVFVPVLLAVVPRRTPSAAVPAGRPVTPGGYREVLADRGMVGVLALSAVAVTLSYGQFHSAFPAWATGSGGIAPSALSLAFAANTLTVVLVQLPVLRALRGRRRTTGAAVACGGFAATWIVTLVVGGLGGGAAAGAGFAAAMVLFGVSEAALAPTLPALVNDLATDELRGRYNGASTLAWTTGFLVGPALAGIGLSSPLGGGWFVALAIIAAATALGAIALGRRLPDSVDIVT